MKTIRIFLSFMLLTITGISLAQGGEITYGDTVDGRTTTGTPDRWIFAGGRDDIIFIEMSSEGFDPYLRLFDEDGVLLVEDDNNGNGYNALIYWYVLPYGGTFTIEADGYNDSNFGRYELTLTSNVIRTEEIMPGDDPSGRLDTAAPDFYTFFGEEGDKLFAYMNSEGFDTYLIVYDEDGNRIVEDDNNGDGYNALIYNYTLPYDGDYTLVARGYNAELRGRYALNFDLASNRVKSITEGDILDLELDTPFPDIWEFDASEGEVLYISMESSIFDTYLKIYDEDGNVIIENDNDGASYDALIYGYSIPFSGTYTLYTRGYNTDLRGKYRLFFDTNSNLAQPLTESTVIEDELENDMPHIFVYKGKKGERISVQLQATTFDAYLQIFDEKNLNLITDDNSGDGYDALVSDYELPSDGAYVIRVRGYDINSLGAYTLTFSINN